MNKLFTLTLPKNTHVVFFGHSIIMKGPRGTIAWSCLNLIRSKGCYFVVKHNTITLCNKENNASNRGWLTIHNGLKNMVYGIHYFYSKPLLFVGIGFRIWTKLTSSGPVLVAKVRFSKDLYIPIPEDVFVIPLNPNLLLIRGLSKESVNQFCSFVRSFKKPDKYKGKGIQYKNEILSLKPGKQN
jgi:large subunit ribosomal protein L6